MQEIYDRLNHFSEQMQLHYASPNNDLIVEIMQLDAGMLSSLTSQQLTQYVFVLGQYLVMLQYNENMKNIEHKLSQKTFEHHLNKTKFERDDVVGKTEKERNAWLMLHVPEIQALADDALAKEAEKMLIDGMVRAVEGLLNALKKEVSGRIAD